MKIIVKNNFIIYSCIFLITLLCSFPEKTSAGNNSNDLLSEYLNQPFKKQDIKNSNDNYYIPFRLKSEKLSVQVPDSMYETTSNGYLNYYYRWYYEYDAENHLKYLKRKYYNSDNKYDNTTEYRTFDAKGRLILLRKEMPAYLARVEPRDSSLVDKYTEEYQYENDKLIYSGITEMYSSSIFEINSYYEYDENGKLSQEITEMSGQFDTSKYYYNNDGQLNLKINVIYFGGEDYNVVDKYAYNQTDSIQTTIHYFSSDVKDINSLDTLKDWQEISWFKEILDGSERRKSIEVKKSSIYMAEDQRFLIKYLYNKNDKISQQLYFEPDPKDNSLWREVIIGTYYYTNENNLLLYKEYFFDDKTSTWEFSNSNTYYYPGLPTGNSTITEKIQKQILIYPNPSSDKIYISDLNSDKFRYSIYNMRGICNKTGILLNNEIAISDLNVGIYYLIVYDTNQIIRGKFIKK